MVTLPALRARRGAPVLVVGLVGLLAALAGCGETRRAATSQGPRSSVFVPSCDAPRCAVPCACDTTVACDVDCAACDPECGRCTLPELTCRSPDAGVTDGGPTPDAGGGPTDAGGPGGCQETLPPGQTLSMSCCPAWGRDACGALLFCAALDGRTQPTCYPERSRADGETCPADHACQSGACEPSSGRCKARLGGACTPEVGCAPTMSGARTVCDTSGSPPRCAAIGDGSAGAICEAAADCSSGRCQAQRCLGAPGALCGDAIDCGGSAICEYSSFCEGNRCCLTTCGALECTEADPSHWSCYLREIPAPCPEAAPPAPRCAVVAFRADRTAIEVELTWTGSADGYHVQCARADGGGTTSWSQSGAGSPGRTTLILDPIREGERYACTVQYLTRTGHTPWGWLLGPASPVCDVVLN